jgi:hypothetical protein
MEPLLVEQLPKVRHYDVAYTQYHSAETYRSQSCGIYCKKAINILEHIRIVFLEEI